MLEGIEQGEDLGGLVISRFSLIQSESLRMGLAPAGTMTIRRDIRSRS